LPPGFLFAPLSATLAAPRFAFTPSPTALASSLPLPRLAVPALAAPALPAPAVAAALTPAVALANPVRAQLAGAVGSVAQAQPAARTQAAVASLGLMFDGTKARPSANAVDASAARPPDWSEDRRINAAIARLNESPIGRDLYAYVYKNHRNLSIQIDDDHSASYDARLVDQGGRKVLFLTEALVGRQSAETVAAYMAREFSDLYFESFPTSAERGYMSYSNMARVFADLTSSGRAADGYWWNRAKDQLSGGAYAMERYYGSWREAVQDDYYGRRRIQDSPFFGFLKGRDDSNTEPRAKLSLREQYDRGLIGYTQYRQMADYFDSIVVSERDWLNSTGRW
jgi:hypothetical protein